MEELIRWAQAGEFLAIRRSVRADARPDHGFYRVYQNSGSVNSASPLPRAAFPELRLMPVPLLPQARFA